MNHLTFYMQKIQSKKEASKDEGKHWRGKSPYWIAVEEGLGALPQWRMN